MRTLRDIYWIILLLFVATNLLFVFRTEASFWAIGLPQTATDTRKLSADDYDRLDDAGDVVRQIIVAAAVMSLATAVASIVILRSGIIRPRWLPVVVMAASAAWGVFLLTQGSRFALRTSLVSESQAPPSLTPDAIASSTSGSPETVVNAGHENRGGTRSHRTRSIVAREVWRGGVLPVSSPHPLYTAWRRGRVIACSELGLYSEYGHDETAIAGMKTPLEPLPWSLLEKQFDDADEAVLSVMQ